MFFVLGCFVRSVFHVKEKNEQWVVTTPPLLLVGVVTLPRNDDYRAIDKRDKRDIGEINDDSDTLLIVTYLISLISL